MITVGFSRHRGFAPISWLIMLAEGSNFSHAFICVRSETLNRDLIYQATGAGVYFVGKPLFDSLAKVTEEYDIELSKEAQTKLLQWAVDNSGKPYGHMQLVGIGLIRLCKLFGIRITNPFANGGKAYVCCELVIAALEHVADIEPSDLDQVDLVAVRDTVVKIAASQKSVPSC